MLFLNLGIGIMTVFVPLYLYKAFLSFHDKAETKSVVERVADEEVTLAQA